MNDEFDPPKVNIGARIPAAWAEQLKELAINIGCSQTELITEAIGRYLEKPIDKIVDRVTTLERKLDGFNDDGTVDTEVSSELLNKFEQVIKINQTSLKENTELKNTIAYLKNTIANLSHQINNLSDQINNIQQQPPTENMTLVDTGISPELINKLEQFIEIAQAPSKENTEINQTLIKENTELTNTIANLKNQIANLKNTIVNLNHQINNIKQQPPTERLIEPVSDNKFLGGITQTELCIRSGINPGSVNGFAKKAGKSPKEYLAERTGWEYRVRPGGQKGRWYLPEKPLPTE